MDNITTCAIENLCRICLKVQPHMRFLSSSEIIDGKFWSLYQMLKSCTSIQMSLEEGFPNMICQDCINRLYICWDLIMDCKKSEEKLHQKLNLSTKSATTSKKNVIKIISVKDFKNNLIIRRNMRENTRQVIDENMDQLLNNNISSNHNNLINESNRKHCNDTKNVVTFSNLHSSESTRNSLILDNSPVLAYNDTNNENSGNNNIENIENIIVSDSVCEYNNSTVKEEKKNISTQIKKFAVVDLTLSDSEIEGTNDTENKNSENTPPTEQNAGAIIEKKVLANNFQKNKCLYCPKIFVTNKGLKVHMKKHKIYEIHDCPICNKKFSLFSNLEMHLKTHLEKHTLKCPKCPKYFSSTLMFNNHKSVHDVAKTFDCELCCKKFTTCNGLKVHFHHAHSGINKYFCDVCMKGFALKTILNEHRKIHTKDGSHKCNVCKKSFITLDDLTEHSNSHSPSFKCEICDGKFTTDAVLNEHRMQHRVTKRIVCKLDKEKNDNKKDMNDCKICEKKFDTHEKLKTHITTHLTCNVCSESFGTSRLFNIHKKIHLVCSFCKNEFKTITDLNKHLQQHKNIIPN